MAYGYGGERAAQDCERRLRDEANGWSTAHLHPSIAAHLI